MTIKHLVVTVMTAFTFALAVSGCAELELISATPTLTPEPTPTPLPELEIGSETLVMRSDDPAPTATPVPTATPLPSFFNRTGGGKGWVEKPTSTPYPTSTPIPATVAPTASPYPSNTPTPTPYPTPSTPQYVEPEFITRAVSAVWDEELQIEIWGRELWGDEWDHIVHGALDWTTENFMRRCLTLQNEYPPVTELIRERFPDARFYRDSSRGHFYRAVDDRRDLPRMHVYLKERLNEHRFGRSYYRVPSSDDLSKVAHSVVGTWAARFEDCEPGELNVWVREWGNHVNTNMPDSLISLEPLTPDELDDPANIRCRYRNCE